MKDHEIYDSQKSFNQKAELGLYSVTSLSNAVNSYNMKYIQIKHKCKNIWKITQRFQVILALVFLH